MPASQTSLTHPLFRQTDSNVGIYGCWSIAGASRGKDTNQYDRTLEHDDFVYDQSLQLMDDDKPKR